MPDAQSTTNQAKRARGQHGHRPSHAVPSLYAPSPRESVVATGLAVALLAILALVLAGAGGSAAAERNHHPAPAGVAAPRAAIVHSATAVQAQGPAGHASASPTLTGAAPIVGTTAPTLTPGLGLGTGVGPASSFASSGIPATALAAYKQAVARQALLTPACRIGWPLLAGIGRVESNHGRFAGAVLHTDGLSTPPVVGIPLNGHGTAVIRDTDHGRLDGDAVYDRAVGPMQFIPSTWATWGVDADRDGTKNPFDIFDAAAAAAAYLCAAGRDLATYHGQVAAILSYNHSAAYVTLVMEIEQVYASGNGLSVAVLPGTPGPGSPGPVLAAPTLPPVDPGPPRGVPRHSTSRTHSTSHSTPAHPSSSRSTHSSARSSSTTSAPTSSSSSPSSSPNCPPTSSSSSSSSSSTAAAPTTPPSCSSSSPSSAPAAGDSSTSAEHAQSGAAAADAAAEGTSAGDDALSSTTTAAGASGS